MSGPVVLVLRLLLAVALYAFLGWTLWAIWQDLKRAGLQATAHRVPPIRLEIRTKKDAPTYRAFSRSEVTIGRDPACDITIDDEAISVHHAKLSFHHGQWWLQDLESTNGTDLNRVRLTTATVLTSGDEIKCGKTRLIVTLDGAAVLPQISERGG